MSKKRKKYKVIMWCAYAIWDEVYADNKDDAIAKCNYPPEFDSNDEHAWKAIEIE